MRYAHFAKICEKCGKVPNMRQLHIRVFLTCLTLITTYARAKFEVDQPISSRLVAFSVFSDDTSRYDVTLAFGSVILNCDHEHL